MNLDEHETAAAEAMIRFAAALDREGFKQRSDEITKLTVRHFREKCFYAAVRRCADGPKKTPGETLEKTLKTVKDMLISPLLDPRLKKTLNDALGEEKE